MSQPYARRWRQTLLAGLVAGALAGCSLLPSNPVPVTGSPGNSGTATVTTPTTDVSAVTAGPTAQPSSATAPPATVAATTAAPSTATAAPGGSLAGRVIAVDPGHNGANGRHTAEISQPVDAGGFDKACNTTGAPGESAINWQVATRVVDRLRTAGAQVVLTRTDDDGWGPCIDARGRVAADAHADLLISLHADGGPASGHGFHVIHPGPVPGYTDGIVDSSAAAARQVRDSLVQAGFAPATYIGEDGLDERTDLGTLNQARVPAVMLEAGNLTNAGDREELQSPDGQDRLADAVVAGATRFLTG